MTNQPNQTVVIRFVADAQAAIAGAKALRAEIDSTKEKMMAAAKISGQSYKELAAAMQLAANVRYDQQIAHVRDLGKAGKWSAEHMQEQLAPIKTAARQTSIAISTAFSELSKQSKTVSTGFGAIGTALGTALGFGAVQMIGKLISSFNEFINALNEAAISGYELSKAIFQMSVGINALRRAGVQITFAEMYDQLKKLKNEFGIFSTKDLVVGSAAFLNLNRDMGFTKEELFELQEAIATLAIVNGRSMDEVQKTVALALSSGYTEGLQRLGVSINRVTIAEKAAALGYADSYMALNELERAEATRILILEKTAVYAEDLLEYQKTLAGQIDTTTASVKDLTAAAGENLMVFTLLGAKLKELKAGAILAFSEMNVGVRVIRGLYDWFSKLSRNSDALIDNLLNAIEVNKALVNSFLEVGFSIQGVKDLLTGQIDNLEEYWQRVQSILAEKIQAKPPEVISPEAAGLTDDQLDEIENAAKEIEEIEREGAIDRRDARIELMRDLAEIERDGAQEVIEINQDYQDELVKIADDAAEEAAKAVRKYDLDVQAAWEDYYNGVAQAQLGHNNKLLKIEEDYQEKLLRLREGFLLDLDDALQARDARQVLTLIKRYNLEKNQAQRERDQNIREEERAYQEQLATLAMQREERLRQLRVELDARLREIRLQKQKELREAWEDHIAKLEQQKEDQRRRRQDRILDYKQELQDIRRHNQDRINEIAQGLYDAGVATDTGLQGIMDVLETYIGPKGAMVLLWQQYAALVRAALTPPAMSIASPTTPPARPPKAQGGIEYANRPTTALFGEAGPELALFLPLRGGLGSISTRTQTNVPEVKTEEKGKVEIDVLLSPDLEATITDNTMNKVADVILRRMR